MVQSFKKKKTEIAHTSVKMRNYKVLGILIILMEIFAKHWNEAGFIC